MQLFSSFIKGITLYYIVLTNTITTDQFEHYRILVVGCK